MEREMDPDSIDQDQYKTETKEKQDFGDLDYYKIEIKEENQDPYVSAQEQHKSGIEENQDQDFMEPDHGSNDRGALSSGPSDQQIHTKRTTGRCCQQCGKTYPKPSHLKIHQRVHTGDRPYSCDQCDKTFIGKRGLKQHQRIHTGQKPYTCDQCGKSFITFCLKIHQRVHTGENS